MVEIFVIEETEALIYDNEQLEKWNSLVTELGLEGQNKLNKKDKSPVPFMHMNQSLVRVFQTLCPRKIEVEKYDKTPIPVEILGLVKLSRGEEYFDKIQIWYDDKTPDPVCVGVITDKDRTWGDGDSYLIGRWADVKADFDELRDRATKRCKKEKTVDIKNKISALQGNLANIDSLAEKHIAGDWVQFE